MSLDQRQPPTPLSVRSRSPLSDPATIGPLHEATLHILEHTGVMVAAPEALALFRQYGADVDTTTGTVRLGPDLVHGALAGAPRTFTMAARVPELDVRLSPDICVCSTDGCGTHVIDRVTGERRPSTVADLQELTVLQDYLGSIGFWEPTVGAGDRGQDAALHEVLIGLTGTEKHVMGMLLDARQSRAARDMAAAIAGGTAALRRRPLLSNLVGTVSPLVLDRHGTEAALVFADAGLPVCLVSIPQLGTTAPATRPGAWALGAAEVIAGAVLLQLASPGCPVIGSIGLAYADPRDGRMVSMPVDTRAGSTAVDLLHSFGLPVRSAADGPDAPAAGTWQDGSETALGLFAAALDGAELMTALGLTDTYRLSTPESLLLDDDIYHRVRHALLYLDLSDEEFALEVIHDVGPGGHFLATRHSRAHMRTAFVRGLADDIGPAGSTRDPAAVAREMAERILHEYQPPSLPDDLVGELDHIASAAGRSADSPAPG